MPGFNNPFVGQQCEPAYGKGWYDGWSAGYAAGRGLPDPTMERNRRNRNAIMEEARLATLLPAGEDMLWEMTFAAARSRDEKSREEKSRQDKPATGGGGGVKARRPRKGKKTGVSLTHAPWIHADRKGKLGGPGYLSRPASERRRILDSCVRRWGYPSCRGSVQVLNRNGKVRAHYGSVINADSAYLHARYGAK